MMYFINVPFQNRYVLCFTVIMRLYINDFEITFAEIETIIKGYLPEEKDFQKTVMEAMNYSVLAGGKRLRPALFYRR